MPTRPVVGLWHTGLRKVGLWGASRSKKKHGDLFVGESLEVIVNLHRNNSGAHGKRSALKNNGPRLCRLARGLGACCCLSFCLPFVPCAPCLNASAFRRGELALVFVFEPVRTDFKLVSRLTQIDGGCIGSKCYSPFYIILFQTHSVKALPMTYLRRYKRPAAIQMAVGKQLETALHGA